MKLYTAGPMTFYPQFNYPAFDALADRLRAVGHRVISPAELDSPEDRAAALASPDGDPSRYAGPLKWGDFLARDVKLIAESDLDAIVVLPGWERSRGARLETFVGAGLSNLSVYAETPGGALRMVRRLDLYRAWAAEDDLVLRPHMWHAPDPYARQAAGARDEWLAEVER